MKLVITFLSLMLSTMLLHGQSLYTQTFGNTTDTALIFLHGGPGYNAANFEVTTAQQLADKGFFVIIYDRRGEGRSTDPKAQYTFKESFGDLNAIYQQYALNTATLLGHSFGGIVATLFAEAHPEKVQSIVLIGAPVALQETFKHIIASSKSIYEKNNDTANLNYIRMLEAMDTKSLVYSSYCFGHAMQNGFYAPKQPTEVAKSIYAKFGTDSLLQTYASKMTYEAPQGFWSNEQYTSIDLTNTLQSLLKQKVKIYGLYGKDDGLYAKQQVMDLQNLIGSERLMYYDNCSHNVFIDQQTAFMEQLVRWLK
jgi:proline iminopeptidase